MSDDPLDPDGTGLPNMRYVTLSELRNEIDSKRILQRLQRHALGLEDMTVTEVTAARIALAKTMPDMKAVEHSGKVSVTNAEDLTDEELADIALAGSSRIAAPKALTDKSH